VYTAGRSLAFLGVHGATPQSAVSVQPFLRLRHGQRRFQRAGAQAGAVLDGGPLASLRGIFVLPVRLTNNRPPTGIAPGVGGRLSLAHEFFSLLDLANRAGYIISLYCITN